MIPGVYRSTELAETLDVRVQALRLVVPSDCVVTDRTAAWLWGAEMVLAPGDHKKTPKVSVFAPPGRRLRNGIVASGERRVARRDIREIDGLLVTTPLRTACDLGRLLHMDQAIGAMDMLARLTAFTVPELTTELGRFKGYRGIIQARALAPLVDARAQSPYESVLRLRWYDAGLPRPELQIEVEAPRGSYFIDLGLPEEQIGGEYDGEEDHGPEQAQHDHDRRAWIRSYGQWLLVVARIKNCVGPHQNAELMFRAMWAEHQARRPTWLLLK